MKPFLIGITGPIGGGKSALLNHLASSGVLVINGDVVAKNVIYTEENKNALVSFFGETILSNHKKYNFAEIRRIFFTNQHTRELVQNYFSNKIWKEIEKIAEESGDLFVFVENAVLFEQGWKNYFNLIICLYCNEEEIIRRVAETRNITPKEIKKIISCQMPTETKIELSDISIDTTDFRKDEGDELAKIIMQIIEQKYLP